MDTNNKWHIMTIPLALAGIVATLATTSCDDNALCCTEGDFQVGGTITAGGEAGVALQAVADVAAVASASLDDLTTACRAIAEDLEAPAAERQEAAATEDKRERMDAWCNLAASAIVDFKARAGGSLTVDIQPPQCSASVSAKADCQASCSGSAECDVKANPPTCEGGKLEISCSGSCSAEGSASVSCQGGCDATCEGSCTADAGGVECQGRCDGTCTASAMGGGDGIQADGTCDGNCEGTCEVVAPNAQCSGSCNGSCTGECSAQGDVAVKCDGTCDGDFEPLKCEGGELSGGCEVEAECDANCNASASAKAECTPARLDIAFSGNVDAEAAGKLRAVLAANLGLIVGIRARLEGMAEIVATLAGNINAEVLADVKVVCIPVVAAAIAGAVDDISGSISGSVMVMGSIN
jgi:hypothetical protein